MLSWWCIAFIALPLVKDVSNLGTRRHYVPMVPSCVTRVEGGFLKGIIQYSSTGKAIEAYRGIPYAVPPLGPLRFKHPVPFGRWGGYLDATRYGDSCVQRRYTVFRGVPGLDRFIPATPFSEDCLTLNVFVPNPRPTNASVMVFIHGGGFSIGGTSVVYFDGSELAGVENVIVVSMNYRLASLGFLSLNHPDVDSNCGLMDQLLALRWIKTNVKRFGGNPNEITLFGNSAGAMSVGYHALSPMSKGLFKRAILESGTAFSYDFIVRKEDNFKLAYQTGKNLNCSNYSNTASLLNCLREIDAKTLVENEPVRRFMPFLFRPIVDGKFIVEDPSLQYRNNKKVSKVEILMGTVKNEGTLFLSMVYPLVYAPLFDLVGPYHDEFVNVIKFYLPNKCDSLRKTFENIYTDWSNLNNTNSTLKSSEDFLADFWFNCPMEMALDLYTQSGSKIYVYLFTHRSRDIDFVRWVGIPHTEELRYLMGEATREKRYNEDDKRFGYRIMRYWANFARNGDPNISPSRSKNEESTVKWPTYSKNSKSVFVLNAGSDHEVFRRLDTPRCAFWKNKYTVYRNYDQGKCPNISVFNDIL